MPDGVCGAELVSPPSEGRTSPAVSDRVNILGVGATPQDLNTAVATLERWRAEQRQEYVCVVSVHGLALVAQREPHNPARPQPLRHGDRRRACRHRVVVATSRVSPRRAGRFVAPICTRRRRALSRSAAWVPPLLLMGPLKDGGTADRAPSRPLRGVTGYRSPLFRPLTPAEDAAEIAAISTADRT